MSIAVVDRQAHSLVVVCVLHLVDRSYGVVLSVVSDLEASIAFYEGVLRFVDEGEIPFPGGGTDSALLIRFRCCYDAAKASAFAVEGSQPKSS